MVVVDRVWNVTAQAQSPDFVFRRKGRVHLNRPGGGSVQSTTGSRGVCISGSNAGYIVFWVSVKGTGYPLHSPVSSSLSFPCVTVCHHFSTGLYFSLSLCLSLSPCVKEFEVNIGVRPLSNPFLISHSTKAGKTRKIQIEFKNNTEEW